MKIALAVTVLAVAFLAAEAVNIKKTYCNNEEYIGNRGGKYPHLHCGKSFITLSKTKTNHLNMQGKCNTVNRVLGDPQGNYGNAGNPGAITAVLRAYANADCPTLLKKLFERLVLKMALNI